MSDLHRLDVVEAEGNRISSIINGDTSMDLEILTHNGSGHDGPLWKGAGEEKPVVSFGTLDLKAVLSTIGVPIGGLVLTQAANQFWKKISQVASESRSSLTHTKQVVNAGVLYWETINLLNNDKSNIDCKIAAVYDGSNDTIVTTGSIALPTTALSAVSVYGVGPIQLNGTLFKYIQSVTISSGITLTRHYSDSDSKPYRVETKVAPTVTILTEKISDQATLGFRGGSLNGTTGLAVYGREFVKDVSGGVTRTPATTATHFKASFPSGTYRANRINASEDGTAQLEIIAEISAKDSATALASFATNSAIPTS